MDRKLKRTKPDIKPDECPHASGLQASTPSFDGFWTYGICPRCKTYVTICNETGRPRVKEPPEDP